MSLQIRKASIEDVNIIAGLFNDYRFFYNQSSDMDAAKVFLKERIENNESVIFLAYDNDKPVGFTQLYPVFSSVSLSKAWLLNDLFVAKTGRRKGVATALLNKAREYGKETNAKWLMLQTAKDNSTAQKVYENNGWIKESDFFYTISC